MQQPGGSDEEEEDSTTSQPPRPPCPGFLLLVRVVVVVTENKKGAPRRSSRSIDGGGHLLKTPIDEARSLVLSPPCNSRTAMADDSALLPPAPAYTAAAAGGGAASASAAASASLSASTAATSRLATAAMLRALPAARAALDADTPRSAASVRAGSMGTRPRKGTPKAAATFSPPPLFEQNIWIREVGGLRAHVRAVRWLRLSQAGLCGWVGGKGKGKLVPDVHGEGRHRPMRASVFAKMPPSAAPCGRVRGRCGAQKSSDRVSDEERHSTAQHSSNAHKHSTPQSVCSMLRA